MSHLTLRAVGFQPEVPYCSFSVHTAGNTCQRAFPRLYPGETIFVMCPLDPEGGGFGPVGLLGNQLVTNRGVIHSIIRGSSGSTDKLQL